MKAFLAGLGIGVALGFLFAPDEGQATRSKVRQRLNHWTKGLSQQLDRINPTVAGEVSPKGAEGAEMSNRRAAASAAVEPSNEDAINTLTREELMTVNGIGPVLADRILAGRPYSSREEVVERGIIGESTLREFERQFGRQRRSA